jgi:hypothetical protein
MCIQDCNILRVIDTYAQDILIKKKTGKSLLYMHSYHKITSRAHKI